VDDQLVQGSVEQQEVGRPWSLADAESLPVIGILET
jgi:hypothetical protein